MFLYSHLFIIQIRRSWVLVAFYLASLILMVIVPSITPFTGSHDLGFLITVLAIGLGVSIVLSLNHRQSPASSETWWLTRPISRSQMVKAHFQFILITLAGPLLLAQIATLVMMDATSYQVWIGMVIWFQTFVVMWLIYAPSQWTTSPFAAALGSIWAFSLFVMVTICLLIFFQDRGEWFGLASNSLVLFSLLLIQVLISRTQLESKLKWALFPSMGLVGAGLAFLLPDVPETIISSERFPARLALNPAAPEDGRYQSFWNGLSLTSDAKDEILQPLEIHVDSDGGSRGVIDFSVTWDRDISDELACDLVSRQLPSSLELNDDDAYLRRSPSVVSRGGRLVADGISFDGKESATLIGRKHRLLAMPELELVEGARSCSEGIAITIVEVQSIQSVRINFQITAISRSMRSFSTDRLEGKIVWLLCSESTGEAILSVDYLSKPEDLIGFNLFGEMRAFGYPSHRGRREQFKLRPYLISPGELVECPLEIEAGHYWEKESRKISD